jgi:hypothetical protein
MAISKTKQLYVKDMKHFLFNSAAMDKDSSFTYMNANQMSGGPTVIRRGDVNSSTHYDNYPDVKGSRRTGSMPQAPPMKRKQSYGEMQRNTLIQREQEEEDDVEMPDI